MLKKLFSSFDLGNATLPNRIIRAAMHEPHCVGGMPREEFLQIHERHIEGGVGMTTTGLVAVHPVGRLSPDQLDFSSCFADDLLPLTNSIHSLGGLISANLSFVTPPNFIFPHDQFSDGYALKVVADCFADCASLAVESGFDAIELHHLMTSFFIYEKLNTRGTDDSCGPQSLESRSLFCRAVLSRMRQAVGQDFPILMKVNYDPAEIELDDYVEICTQHFAPYVDAIIPYYRQIDNPSDDESVLVDQHQLYNLEIARVLRDELLNEDSSTIVVYGGGIGTGEDLEILLQDEEFELVQVGRALLRDYDWPRKIRDGGDSGEIEECIRCNGCVDMLAREDKLACVFNKNPF